MMNEAILTALAPHGELRAAINMSNFLEGKIVVVTGGSGFIGSHFLLELVVD